MLASAVTTLPVGAEWAFEFKWDGVRALLDIGEDGVRIRSRNGNDVSGGYPELLAQAEGAGDALLDGEIVAFDGARPSFGRLQQRMHVRGRAEVARLAREMPVTFVTFDILRRYGVDLRPRPWRERRATLDRFAEEHPDWTVSPVFDDGPATEQVARESGLEGVVAKRVDAPYVAGRGQHLAQAPLRHLRRVRRARVGRTRRAARGADLAGAGHRLRRRQPALRRPGGQRAVRADRGPAAA